MTAAFPNFATDINIEAVIRDRNSKTSQALNERFGQIQELNDLIIYEAVSADESATRRYMDSYYRAKSEALDKTTVGLGNVDNTADIDKPVSTATLDHLSETMEQVGIAFNFFTNQVNDALATKIDVGPDGKLPQAAIPAQAMTDFLGVAANQAAMLAMTGQRGDWCTRSDRGTDWQLINEPSSALASWREKSYPASPVSSVSGRVGAITLSKIDVGLNNVDNTADLLKPVSVATNTALQSKVSTDGTITNMVRLTQAQYDSLSPKVSTTLYVIVG